MKNIIAVLLILMSVFLAGCNVEKKVTIPKSDPDNLFLRAQGIFKEEMPRAKMDVDVTQRVLKVIDPENVDYPNYIEIKFDKNQGNTDVTVIAEDNEQKLKNLEFLLTEKLKKSQIFDGAVEMFNKQKQNIKAYEVKTEKDHLMDKNNDGWVDAKEKVMWMFKSKKNDSLD